MSEPERAREIKSAELALLEKEMQLDEVGRELGGHAAWQIPGRGGGGVKTKTKALSSRYDLGFKV